MTKKTKKGKKVWVIVPFARDDPRYKIEELDGVTKRVIKGNTYWFHARLQLTNPIALTKLEALIMVEDLLRIRMRSVGETISKLERHQELLKEQRIDMLKQQKKLEKG